MGRLGGTDPWTRGRMARQSGSSARDANTSRVPQRHMGIVKRFFPERSYGFISRENGGDGFFQADAAPADITHDVWVDFQLQSDGRGRSRAFQIRRLPLSMLLRLQRWWRRRRDEQRRCEKLRLKQLLVEKQLKEQQQQQLKRDRQREHENMMKDISAILDFDQQELEAFKAETPCKFWNGDSGCRNGDRCGYGHWSRQQVRAYRQAEEREETSVSASGSGFNVVD